MTKSIAMTEFDARDILKDVTHQTDGKLQSTYAHVPLNQHYVYFEPGDPTVSLDGDFTAEQLEALAWWIRNKTK